MMSEEKELMCVGIFVLGPTLGDFLNYLIYVQLLFYGLMLHKHKWNFGHASSKQNEQFKIVPHT